MVLPLAMDAVVFEHVSHVVCGDERIVNGDELNIIPEQSHPGDQTADPSESVDANLNLGHYQRHKKEQSQTTKTNERTEAQGEQRKRQRCKGSDSGSDS
uniref:Uncharacterized protein MANES_17G107100 n=1 Tax=Rhizophora mucronata TaxID=61149 RepID=A0A2P2JDU5_RHIMU